MALVDNFRRQFGDRATNAVLASAEIAGLLWPLVEHGSLQTPGDHIIEKALSESSAIDQGVDLQSMKEHLFELRNASAHLKGLQEMETSIERLLFKQTEADPNQLVKVYEKEILPAYTKELSESDAPLVWLSTGFQQINSLFPSGQSEFSFYVPSYLDQMTGPKGNE